MEENFQRDFSEVFKNVVIEMFSASNEYVYQNDLMHYFYGTSQYSTLFTLENTLPQFLVYIKENYLGDSMVPPLEN